MPLNQFSTPDVAIGTENIVIPAPGAGVLFKVERVESPPEYFIQHFSVCLPLLIQPLLRNMVLLD